MQWLNTLNTHWAPVLWILLAGVFFLIWFLAVRSKHRSEIREAAVEVHRRRFLRGEISQKEFDDIKQAFYKDGNKLSRYGGSPDTQPFFKN